MTEKSHSEALAEELTQASDSESRAEPRDEQTVYEIGFHVVPTAAEDAVAAVVERVRKELERGNAEIIAEEFPKRMTLSYRIERSVAGKREKYTESYFGWIKFEISPAEIPALETFLRSQKDILRYLLIQTIRENVALPPRAIFASDRLEGEVIRKPVSAAAEPAGEVSEEELDKSIDALVN